MAERTDPVPAEPARFEGVVLSLLAPTRRYSLRTRTPEGLPEALQTSAPLDDGTAFKLGPDEWLLLLPDDAAAPQIAGTHALVDVSERSLALEVKGSRAETLLQTGCPLDLGSFPVGKVTRTLFETIEIVLWREDETRFRVEVWKSFAPWLWDALVLNAGDLPR